MHRGIAFCMSNHTPEPWKVDQTHPADIQSGDGRWELMTCAGVTFNLPDFDTCYANTHRAVAAVNACAGMDDPEKDIAALKSQRDELLAVLKDIVERCEAGHDPHEELYLLVPARAAIAKAENQKPEPKEQPRCPCCGKIVETHKP